jgi:hypothetical protein
LRSTIESRTDFVNIWFDTNAEEWMTMLGPETFASRFLPMTQAEAAAIVHAFARAHRGAPVASVEAEAAHAAALAGINSRLDALMSEVKSLAAPDFGGDGRDAAEAASCTFVKTSCRSPKDTVLYNGRFKERIIECLAEFTAANGRTPLTASDNGILFFAFSFAQRNTWLFGLF